MARTSLLLSPLLEQKVPPAPDAMAGGTFSSSANREDALHPQGGVAGHRAEVAVIALLLEADGDPRRLSRLDHRRALAVDREIVSQVAGVLEVERHRAGPRNRLRRELEGVLLPADLNRGCARDRLRFGACRGELD